MSRNECPPRSRTASHSRLVIERRDRSRRALVREYQSQSPLYLRGGGVAWTMDRERVRLLAAGITARSVPSRHPS
jgi:hypothetical protein